MLKQLTAGLFAAAALSAGAIQASDMYAWKIANITCEHIGYGLSFSQALKLGLDEALSNSLYRDDFMRDNAIKVGNSDIAAKRIIGQIVQKCGAAATQAAKR